MSLFGVLVFSFCDGDVICSANLRMLDAFAGADTADASFAAPAKASSTTASAATATAGPSARRVDARSRSAARGFTPTRVSLNRSANADTSADTGPARHFLGTPMRSVQSRRPPPLNTSTTA